MLGIYVVTGDFGKVMGIVSLAPFSTVADYALTTIPMFILRAFFSASSGLARDLYTAASTGAPTSKAGSPSPPSSPAAFSAPCRARAPPPPR
jgi:C4-dicarboxylate transporter, DctM subunit